MGWGRGRGPCLYCLEGENRATPLGHMHSAGVQSTAAVWGEITNPCQSPSAFCTHTN